MTVVFGKEVTCIGDHLFMGCLRLKDIYIEAPIPPAVADGLIRPFFRKWFFMSRAVLA